MPQKRTLAEAVILADELVRLLSEMGDRYEAGQPPTLTEIGDAHALAVDIWEAL